MVNPEIVENFLAGKGLFDSQTYKDQDDSTISKELALIYPRLPIFSKLKHHQKVGFLLNVDREYFLDLFEFFLSFACILAFPSTFYVFINISLLSHAWNCFSQTIANSATHLTHMHVVLFYNFEKIYF